MTVQRMNIEILPSEGETKHLGQLIFFKNAVQVELEQNITCAWATFTSSPARVEVSKVPTEGHTQTLRRQCDPITPLRIKNVDDDGKTEEDAPENATMDDEDDRTDKKKNNILHSRSCACSERRQHHRRRTPRLRQRTGRRHD